MVNLLGIRNSSRLAALCKKNKKKQLDPTLNHTGLINVMRTSEEEIDPMKDTCAYKEAMNSPCKTNIVKSTEKEMQKYDSLKCWQYFLRESASFSQKLRPE